MRTRKKFKYFYDSWWFLHDHSIFVDKSLDDGKKTYKHALWSSRFQDCLEIDVQKVNPKKSEIDDNISLNTETEVWLECGPWEYDEQFKYWSSSRDQRLDCGGITFEGAIINLANLVLKYYGNSMIKYL